MLSSPVTWIDKGKMSLWTHQRRSYRWIVKSWRDSEFHPVCLFRQQLGLGLGLGLSLTTLPFTQVWNALNIFIMANILHFEFGSVGSCRVLPNPTDLHWSLLEQWIGTSFILAKLSVFIHHQSCFIISWVASASSDGFPLVCQTIQGTKPGGTSMRDDYFHGSHQNPAVSESGATSRKSLSKRRSSILDRESSEIPAHLRHT